MAADSAAALTTSASGPESPASTAAKPQAQAPQALEEGVWDGRVEAPCSARSAYRHKTGQRPASSVTSNAAKRRPARARLATVRACPKDATSDLRKQPKGGVSGAVVRPSAVSPARCQTHAHLVAWLSGREPSRELSKWVDVSCSLRLLGLARGGAVLSSGLRPAKRFFRYRRF